MRHFGTLMTASLQSSKRNYARWRNRRSVRRSSAHKLAGWRVGSSRLIRRRAKRLGWWTIMFWPHPLLITPLRGRWGHCFGFIGHAAVGNPAAVHGVTSGLLVAADGAPDPSDSTRGQLRGSSRYKKILRVSMALAVGLRGISLRTHLMMSLSG